ncbi:MAG: shikimate kinase [Bacteroidetes bacterium]|nr:shikimate kinase [Bacteroidota bacterium]
MKIYLTGFMGSGKSTLGRRLARLARLPFIDLDREIERREGVAISAIFSEKGEGYFRMRESAVLREIGSGDDVVVATGGGTPCFGDNMDYMNLTGITVYLRLGPAALASRLEQSQGSRPLLAGLKGESLRRYIEERLADREPYYLRARLVIDTLHADHHLLLERIRGSGC